MKNNRDNRLLRRIKSRIQIISEYGIERHSENIWKCFCQDESSRYETKFAHDQETYNRLRTCDLSIRTNQCKLHSDFHLFNQNPPSCIMALVNVQFFIPKQIRIGEEYIFINDFAWIKVSEFIERYQEEYHNSRSRENYETWKDQRIGFGKFFLKLKEEIEIFLHNKNKRKKNESD
jgi:hypothetical protein